MSHVLTHPIIASYDGSASSRNALAYALGLARMWGRQLLVVHVVHVPVYAGPQAAGSAALFDAGLSERWLRSELAEVADHSGVDVHVCARRGSPVRELQWVITAHRADAIVIGAPSRSWRYVPGSVPAGLVRRASCPVIVVP